MFTTSPTLKGKGALTPGLLIAPHHLSKFLTEAISPPAIISAGFALDDGSLLGFVDPQNVTSPLAVTSLLTAACEITGSRALEPLALSDGKLRLTGAFMQTRQSRFLVFVLSPDVAPAADTLLSPRRVCDEMKRALSAELAHASLRLGQSPVLTEASTSPHLMKKLSGQSALRADMLERA